MLRRRVTAFDIRIDLIFIFANFCRYRPSKFGRFAKVRGFQSASGMTAKTRQETSCDKLHQEHVAALVGLSEQNARCRKSSAADMAAFMPNRIGNS